MLTLKIFEGINPLQHEPIIDQFCTRKLFVDHQAIVEKDRPGSSMYIVLSGAVQVKVASDVTIDLKLGDAFGEICLIDGGVRTATVFCSERCEVARMDREHYAKLRQERPDDWAILSQNIALALAGRLRRADDTIRDVVRELKQKQRPASLGRRLLAVVNAA